MNDSFSATPLLIIGSHSATRESAHAILQARICEFQGCKTCLSCMQISANQHANIVSITPIKQYTIDEIDQLRQVTSFQRSVQDPLFIILERIDTISDTVGNSLLKLLEEPPAHYYFFLLATRQQQVLPTIRSRCHIIQTTSHSQAYDSVEQLYALFTQISFPDPSTVTQIIDKTAAPDHDMLTLLDLLLTHWSARYQTAITHNNDTQAAQASYAMQIITEHTMHPVMPGSAKIFLKNLYLLLFFNRP